MCMVAHKVRIKKFRDSSIEYLLKKNSILTLCAHTAMHSEIHAHSRPCTQLCKQASMHKAMYTVIHACKYACTVAWMEVYMNQANYCNQTPFLPDQKKKFNTRKTAGYVFQRKKKNQVEKRGKEKKRHRSYGV